MKQNKVLSKYKNPDKYIEQLKRESERLHQMIFDDYKCYEKERGEVLFNYSKNCFSTETLGGRSFGDLKVRQTISIIGTVEEVSEKVVCYDNGENESTVKIRLLQVRSK